MAAWVDAASGPILRSFSNPDAYTLALRVPPKVGVYMLGKDGVTLVVDGKKNDHVFHAVAGFVILREMTDHGFYGKLFNLVVTNEGQADAGVICKRAVHDLLLSAP